MKYLIYARVSPKGSDWNAGETSIEMQINLCQEYVKIHNGEIVNIVRDEFVSGKDIDRPGFSGIVAELSAGRAEWDTLVVYKLSRMTRSQKDAVNLFAELFKQGKGFVSVTEKFDYSNPAGRAMLGIMQVFNQFEREQTAENIRNKMINMASKGLWPTGNPPFGYKRGEKKDCRLYIDPRKSEIVKDIFNMYLAQNITTTDILKKYHSVISKAALFRLLRNTVYLGKIPYANYEFDGQHPAIISQAVFDAVQAKIPSSKTAPRYKAQKYNYLLSGIMKCHCGHTMSPASAKAGRYHYYVCTDPFCKNRVSAEKAEQKAIEIIASYKIPESLKRLMREEAVKEREEFLARLKPEIDQARQALNEAALERNKLYKRFLEVEDKDQWSFLNNRMNYLSKEISRLEARIEVLKNESEMDTSVYDFVDQQIDSIETTQRLITIAHADDNPDILRSAILKNIKCIKNIKDDEFQAVLADSSPNCIGWWSMQDVLELLGVFKFRVA